MDTTTSHMQVSKDLVNAVMVVRLRGNLDSSSAGELHDEIVPILLDKHPVLLDFTGVGHVTDAGLRTMLVVYRQAQAVDGLVAVVGLSQELRSALAATGFLRFFLIADDVAGGLDLLQGATA